MRRLDTKIRKLLTCNRKHQTKADVDRHYIPRNEGGSGMIQLELSYKASTVGQHKYLTTTTDWMLQLVLVHDKTKNAHSISKQSYKLKDALSGLKQFLATENTLEMMKKAFYFTSKPLLVLKIFKFLS